jgi:hypothetical protein
LANFSAIEAQIRLIYIEKTEFPQFYFELFFDKNKNKSLPINQIKLKYIYISLFYVWLSTTLLQLSNGWFLVPTSFVDLQCASSPQLESLGSKQVPSLA